MPETATIQLPPRLAEQVKQYVQAGWFPDLNTLVVEALRRYLETHRSELTERFIREDVEWGLHGKD
jgi:Arc/MetJ-type ribon-helix-helix transcriptional regulator